MYLSYLDSPKLPIHSSSTLNNYITQFRNPFSHSTLSCTRNLKLTDKFHNVSYIELISIIFSSATNTKSTQMMDWSTNNRSHK